MMKKSLLILFLITLALSSCSPERDLTNALIIGEDRALCPCCGGFFILINHERYRFGEIPEGSDLDIRQETFPIPVRVEWKKAEHPCLGDEIELLFLEKA